MRTYVFILTQTYLLNQDRKDHLGFAEVVAYTLDNRGTIPTMVIFKSNIFRMIYQLI
ncbi:hypothetical protein YSY43_15570 [Paenibacillus sp. YSY-4.3]